MIGAEVAERHRILADLRPLKRELLVEALDGVTLQVEAAIRFTERGYADDYAREAVKRAAEIFRTAVSVTNELHAENRRIAAASERSKSAVGENEGVRAQGGVSAPPSVLREGGPA